MQKLKETKKITLATVKSFIKRNSDSIYTQEISSFSGMSDCVEHLSVSEREWKKTEASDVMGFNGVYFVGRGRDYFSISEDDTYYGVRVYNSCGSGILAVKKNDRTKKLKKLLNY